MEELDNNLFCEDSVYTEDCKIFGESCETTCFLCLNEISPSLSTEHSNLIKVEDSHAQGDAVVQEKFSLTPICRYLNLNKSQDLNRTRNLNDADFSVNLCQLCQQIGLELSDLCLELELVQMKISHHLRKFTGKLGKQTGSQLVAAYHRSVNTSFRDTLKSQCNQKLDDVYPKVQLTRQVSLDDYIRKPVPSLSEYSPEPNHNIPEGFSDDDSANSSEVPPSENSCPPIPNVIRVIFPSSKSKMIWKCPDCPAEYSHQRNLYTHQKRKHQLPSRKRCPSIQKNKKFRDKTRKKCNLCNPPRTFIAPEYKRHQVIRHIEIFFTAVKLPHLSPPDFKIYCEHVIKVEMLSASKTTNSDGIPSFQCPHCPNMYQEQKGFRAHLFASHQQILSGKISALQKSSSVTEIKEMSQITGGTDGGIFNCDACGRPCAHKISLRRHKIHFCPRGPNKPVPTRKKMKCGDCPKVFGSEERLLKHRELEHPAEAVTSSLILCDMSK